MGTLGTQYNPKSITLFLDGTWQKSTQENPTNISLLKNSLADKTEDGRDQVGYYFNGVGSVGTLFQRAVSGLTGHGIEKIAKDAYKKLVLTYRPGDEVNLIGFSRGSTIARTLAGMIHKVGLIDERNITSEAELDELIDEAYDLYRNHAFPPKGDKIQPGRDDAEYFRHKYAYTDDTTDNNNTVTINNLMCFDTVGALGVPDIIPGASIINAPYKFYDARIPQSVEQAYHLIAADEMRDVFSLTAMRVGDDNHTTNVSKLYLPGDHGSIGGGHAERKGLSDHAAMRAIEMLDGKIAFDPETVAETFSPDIYSSALTSNEFYEESNNSWVYWLANLFNGKKPRPTPTCDILHRECVDVDPSIAARFTKLGLLPQSIKGLTMANHADTPPLSQGSDPATETPPFIAAKALGAPAIDQQWSPA